jgi:glycine cleavage system H lipoate-binding protein
MFVVLMFVFLVLVDLGLVKWRAWREVGRAQDARVPSAAAEIGDWRWLPEGVHLTAGHTWLKPDPTGGIEVGADAFLAHTLGAVDRIVLPKPGEEVHAGRPLFRMENQGRSVEVPAALDGRVVAINSRLEEHREWLSADPYQRGWLCYLSGTPAREQHFASGPKAIRWLEGEFRRLREFLSLRVSPVLAVGLTGQDGGMPIAGCLSELDASAWAAFESEFLRRDDQ